MGDAGPHEKTLKGASGRIYNLTLTSLSATTTLAHDKATPTTPLLLTTHLLPTPAAKSAFLHQATLYQTLQKTVPHLLPLRDVIQPTPHKPILHLLHHHHPPHPCPLPEQSALSLVNILSATVHTLSANAIPLTLSIAHLHASPSGTPLLRGPAPPLPSPSPPAAQLAALLHELLFGASPTPGVVPKSPPISPQTLNLLRSALPPAQAPDLHLFRYDLLAALGRLPVCPPSAPRPSPAQVKPPPSPKSQSPPVSADGPAPALDIAALVRLATSPDPTPVSQSDLQHIAEACVRSPDAAPDAVFKALFTLPISKNPLAAFKAVTLVHTVLSDGPAKFTALAVAHDGFLNWTESSWSQERLHVKQPAKTHALAYCFAAGEIALYTAIVRKRVEVQARFAQAFSTHWVPRPEGRGLVQKALRPVFTFVLDIVEKCGALLAKIVSCADPVADVKKRAVPVLVGELAKSYLVLCWIFATAESAQKPALGPELAVAHHATRAAIRSVQMHPELAAECASNALLKLGEDVPTSFDEQELVAALKKKRKRKKKKVVLNGGDAVPVLNGDREKDGVESPTEERTRPKRRTAAAEQQLESGEVEVEPRVQRKESDEDRPPSRANRNVVQNVSNVSPVHRPPVAPPRRAAEEPAVPSERYVPVNGMSKLSLSVRGVASRHPYGEDYRAGGGARRFNRPPVRGRSASPDISARDRVVPARRYVSSEQRHYSESESDGSDREQATNGKSHALRRRTGTDGKRQTKASRRDVESSSESGDSSNGERPVVKPERGRKPKGKTRTRKTKKSTESSTSGSEDSDSEEEKGKLRQRKRAQKKERADEKKIPFDKELPKKKKTPAKKNKTVQQQEEEHSGGSKEALAAAASGKKTPNINPKFEIAPYEVQFGPQIGSGGFGVVFKAKFRTETVAIKKIHAHALSNAASVAEFQSEVAVLCTLRHPNILRFVGACTRPPHLMIITEFMSRGTLFDVLHQSQMRVTWPMRKKFALDTCKGMRYLHESKLLHRDLKSSNLMLDKDFNCKVGDFGLTRISRGTAAVQMTGQCGTFQYMAVEVLANKPYSEKADVFSFGILLWEMVARKLPYFGMQPMQVGIAVLQRGMRPPVPPKCPLPLTKLMRACWDSDPSRRPSFAQLVQALEAMPE